MFARSLGELLMDLIIWRIGFGFGLKLIIEYMEMTKMAETHDAIDYFPVPRVGPRHSTIFCIVFAGSRNFPLFHRLS